MNPNFKPFGASVIGSAHLRKKMPNQDAFRYVNLDGGVQILAVSDGHGGALHCHSDRGAKIAVEVAIDVCSVAFASWSTNSSLEALHFDLEERLSLSIQQEWMKRINHEPDFEDKVQFGCTLLIGILTETQLFFVQLGDGKIALVYEDGVVYFPISRDEHAATHITHSLSQDCAWLQMKVVSMPLEESLNMVILATDGVENAYPNDYYDDASFYMNLASIDKLEQGLSEMLQSAELYSKDDCTVALLKNQRNGMLDRSCAFQDSNELMIWIGENHLPHKTIAELSEVSFNKKIELAVLMVDAFKRNSWKVPKHLTLKKMFFDEDASSVDWICTNACITLTDERLREWLQQYLDLPFDEITCENSKKQLVMVQRCLRYDYNAHSFYSSHDFNGYHLALMTPIGNFEVFHNSDLYLHQIMNLTTGTNHLIGSVTQHVKHPQIWGIVNKTQHVWKVFGSHQDEVLPGKILTLKQGITFFPFGLPVKIQIN